MQIWIQIWDPENVHMDPDPIMVLVPQICPQSSVFRIQIQMYPHNRMQSGFAWTDIDLDPLGLNVKNKNKNTQH